MAARAIGICHRCGATTRPRDQWAILFPSAEVPIAVVTICTGCLRELATWLRVDKTKGKK
jgi:hypothetical protein